MRLVVPRGRAADFYDFMIEPSDERYQAWWPGEHLQFHIVKRGAEDHVGDDLFMDEYLGGRRRLTFAAVVVEAERPRKIVWQMKKFGLRLPAFVELGLEDFERGLRLKHEMRLGFSGVGRVLDPFIRIYFNRGFVRDLEEHCRIEWPKLVELLESEK